MDTYLGIDYGGTKLLIGEVSAQGEILESREFKTGKTSQREVEEQLRKSLKEYVRTVRPKGRIKAAGLGILGVSDSFKGLWRSLDHKKGEDILAAKLLTEILGVPGTVDNDVRCGTLAELLWGCGKRSKDFIYISVGTGLAAGFVIDGKLLRGSGQRAGEIGHMAGFGEESCPCGRKGCAELKASGKGIDRRIRIHYRDYPTGLILPDGESRIPAWQVFSLAWKGDPLCKLVVKEAEETLAQVIGNLARVTDPEAIVLGGGLMRDSRFFREVLEKLDASAVRGVTQGVRLSALKPERVGLLGAAALGKFYVEGEKDR